MFTEAVIREYSECLRRWTLLKMDERNLFCDHQGCGNPASSFGFSQNATKTKACTLHSCLLAQQQLTAYDISAYFFLQSAGDGELLEWRRDLMMQGLGNVSVLEERCDSDLAVAVEELLSSEETLLTVVKQCYQEVQHKVRQRHAEIRQELEEGRV